MLSAAGTRARPRRTPIGLGTREAAELLGVNRARVRQLVAAGLLPFEQTPHGYAFRREQLLTVANARRARFHAYNLGP